MDRYLAGRDGVLGRPRGAALRLHRRGAVRQRHPDRQAGLLVSKGRGPGNGTAPGMAPPREWHRPGTTLFSLIVFDFLLSL